MLTKTQIDQYQSEGYLLLTNFFEEAELNAVESDINGLVEELAAKLERRGKLKNTHQDKSFHTRLTALEEDCPGASVKLHTQGILTAEIARLWSTPKLLDLVETFIGPNIVGHPVWNLRSKTPLNPLATVPWHQDCAYLSPESRRTLQPTAWIPLIDANHENGLPADHSWRSQGRIPTSNGERNRAQTLLVLAD